ncbi:MAG: malonate decarboxylase holo-[acyl-carrier-protein] synthase [Pigmentiphaga sp.]
MTTHPGHGGGNAAAEKPEFFLDAIPDSPRRPPWQRQMLAHLTPDGWRDTLRHPWPRDILPCLEHWATRDLPVVVARQDLDATPASANSANTLLLGLAAPQRWGRRRVALRVATEQLTTRQSALRPPRGLTCGSDSRGMEPSAGAVPGQGSFIRDEDAPPARRKPLIPPSHWPSLTAVVAGLSAAPAAWLALPERLRQAGLHARVYGSHGWQHLTGLAYCHDASDLDLLIPVADIATATRAATLLAALDDKPGLLDGELCFPDGRAVAWREWWRWSQGATRVVLFKSIHGAMLATPGETPCLQPV